MTQRDYIKFAAMLKDQRERMNWDNDDQHRAARATLNKIEFAMCDIFAADNERFDRDKFAKAASL